MSLFPTQSGYCIRAAAQNDAALPIYGAVHHFAPAGGSVYHISVSGIDSNMADVHISAIRLKGIEDQIARSQIIVGPWAAAVLEPPY